MAEIPALRKPESFNDIYEVFKILWWMLDGNISTENLDLVEFRAELMSDVEGMIDVAKTETLTETEALIDSKLEEFYDMLKSEPGIL